MTDLFAEKQTDDAPLATSKHLRMPKQGTTGSQASKGSLIVRSVTINRPAAELYAFWRDFSNLSMFMENVEHIDVSDPIHSHWIVKAPAGKTVEWDALVTDELSDTMIAWASAEGADVPNTGRVEFCEVGARGTVVTATILYDPPMGALGVLIAKLFQREPAIQTRRDLRRFKQLMETGEIATAAITRTQYDKERT